MGATWIPLGYMLKRVAPAPGWLGLPHVAEVCALSGCISSSLGDSDWRRNGYGLFDTPAAALAASGADADDERLFYYEAWAQEYVEATAAWRPIAPPDPPARVVAPGGASLLGFDVVTWSVGYAPECSPLSCNGLAAGSPVNSRCLFETADEAIAALSAGRFDKSEPGPFRVVAVFSAPKPD